MKNKYDIVVASGGFDHLGANHVDLFRAAKELGEKLIVGMNSDDWLTRKKGKPFVESRENRMEVVRAIKYVDHIMNFDDSDNTAVDLLYRVRMLYPECHICFVNGGDRSKDATPEDTYCAENGISTEYGVGGDKKRFSSSWDQNAWLEFNKEN